MNNNVVYTADQVILAAGIAADANGEDPERAMWDMVIAMDNIAQTDEQDEIAMVPDDLVPADALAQAASYDANACAIAVAALLRSRVRAAGNKARMEGVTEE